MTIPQPQWIREELAKSKLEKLADRIKRNQFLQSLKRSAEENPVVVLLAAAAIISATAKLINAHGQSQGSRAYAKQVEYRIQRNK